MLLFTEKTNAVTAPVWREKREERTAASKGAHGKTLADEVVRTVRA